MKREQIIRTIHHCGNVCVPKGGAPWCPKCDVYVFVDGGVIDIDLSAPEPPEAA